MADAARIPVPHHPQPPDRAASKPRGDRSLGRVAEDLVSSAERDSVRIVAAAKAEVQQTLLRSHHELHLLAAQTQAMLDLLQARELDERISRRSPADVSAIAASARHVLSRLMRESRAELAALASQPMPAAPIARLPAPVVVSPAAEPEHFAARLSRWMRGRRPPSTLLAAAAILILTFAGAWWALRQRADGPAGDGMPVATAGGTPAPMEVDIEARRPVWIRVAVDGQSDAGRLFRAGEKRRITAGREVAIRAGDAGAVFMSINGGRPAALGRDGQVITRRVRPPAEAGGNPAAGQTGDGLEERVPTAPSAPATGDSTGAGPPTATSSLDGSEERRQQAGRSAPAHAPGAVAGNAPAPVRSELTVAAERWLEAYYAGDRDRMAAASLTTVTISDERAPNERLPGGIAGVQRTLDEASVQVFGSDALLTAKLIERTGNGVAGAAGESVAFISQMWTNRTGEWRLTQVRIVSAAALDRAFKR